MLTDREATLCVELECIIPYAPITISKDKLITFCNHYKYTTKELEFALVDLARMRSLIEVGKQQYCFEKRG